jgi:hypothetical protein
MSENDSVKPVPDEFIKVIKDFIVDLKITFPEYIPLVDKWWKNKESFDYITDEIERNEACEQSERKSIQLLFDFCGKKIPPRFFDILYQNDEIFKEESEMDTEFLPTIHFKNLWQYDISVKTRETIWKYLQLILFSIVGSLENKEAFGDTAKLFEAIDTNDFKNKLEETLLQMQNFFDTSGSFGGLGSTDFEENSGKGINMEDIPDPTQMHDHITGMLDGKLGQLAREIAEETAADLNMDFENTTDMKDVFQNLIKNPTKLMGLVKNVGNKLDSKIKSGDLKETELIAEATEIMNKMKNMPGMGNIQSMLSKMGMGGLGGAGGKMNMGAMESNLNQRMKMAQMKERMQSKAEANAKARAEQEAHAQTQDQKPVISEEELLKLFSSVEKAERTPRGTKPETGKKKKKGKK